MEEIPKDINLVLGNLRRRITKLMNGDFSKGYKDELSEVREYLEYFPPLIIVQNLQLLVNDLKSIPEKVFQTVSDDLNEIVFQEEGDLYTVDHIEIQGRTAGESRRDLMRREVNNYITELEFYIKKYSKSGPNNIVIRYDKFGFKKGKENLENLRLALIDAKLIDKIESKYFKRIFSSNSKDLIIPINWIAEAANEFVYFLDKLFLCNDIHGMKGEERVDYDLVEKCFLFHGEPIIRNTMRRNNSKPSRDDLIDKILQNLKCSNLPIPKNNTLLN